MKQFDIILDNCLSGDKIRCIVFKEDDKYISLYRNWYGNHSPMEDESFGKVNRPARGIKLGRVTRFNIRQVAKMMGHKLTNLRKE